VIEGTRFALFISAAVILALTPGPGILYVLGRTLHGGRREGVLSALGTFVGGSVHVLAAALGLHDFDDLCYRVRGYPLRRGFIPHLPRRFDDSE
jgi:hypothetical protein